MTTPLAQLAILADQLRARAQAGDVLTRDELADVARVLDGIRETLAHQMRPALRVVS